MLLTRIMFVNANNLWAIKRFAFFETFIFLLGPLGLIYIRRLLEINRQNYGLLWVHYIPALIYFLFLISFNFQSDEDFKQKLFSGYYAKAFFTVEFLALLFNTLYLILSIRFFNKIKRNEKEQLSFLQISFKFIKVVFISIGLVMFIWLITFICNHVFKLRSSIINYNTVWIVISLLNYVIGFFALTQPELFRVFIIKKENKKRLRLNHQEIKALNIALKKVITEEKVFLDHKLTLSSLAKKLDTSTNNLSWLINNVCQTTFYDYINKYRINEFLEKVKNKEHIEKTFLSLSFEVGFNSKSTFNKAFKIETNETPSTYIKKMNAENV